ncbi:hypothetical protein MNBD_GAMMA18-1364 [hydrothermal vent metagenome]|uniref:Uncharacterized protein n=1 Tax=hydrothermal vent metagenome TaxID=652676 RepID=A0A3B0YST4_9ZZZZ
MIQTILEKLKSKRRWGASAERAAHCIAHHRLPITHNNWGQSKIKHGILKEVKRVAQKVEELMNENDRLVLILL